MANFDSRTKIIPKLSHFANLTLNAQLANQLDENELSF